MDITKVRQEDLCRRAADSEWRRTNPAYFRAVQNCINHMKEEGYEAQIQSILDELKNAKDAKALEPDAKAPEDAKGEETAKL
jgi:hypothetical protein